MKKHIFPIFVLFVVVFIISLFISEKNKDELLQNSGITNGTIVKYRANMGANYIDYEYTVNNKKYTGYQLIKSDYWNDQLIGANDLKIKYAIDNHAVSTVIDDRFK